MKMTKFAQTTLDLKPISDIRNKLSIIAHNLAVLDPKESLLVNNSNVAEVHSFPLESIARLNHCVETLKDELGCLLSGIFNPQSKQDLSEAVQAFQQFVGRTFENPEAIDYEKLLPPFGDRYPFDSELCWWVYQTADLRCRITRCPQEQFLYSGTVLIKSCDGFRNWLPITEVGGHDDADGALQHLREYLRDLVVQITCKMKSEVQPPSSGV